jgi:hypothetical protein
MYILSNWQCQLDKYFIDVFIIKKEAKRTIHVCTTEAYITSSEKDQAFFMPSLAIAIFPVLTNSLIPIGLRSSIIAAIFFSSPVTSMV